jgi:hypothetical protein
VANSTTANQERNSCQDHKCKISQNWGRVVLELDKISTELTNTSVSIIKTWTLKLRIMCKTQRAPLSRVDCGHQQSNKKENKQQENKANL